MSEYVQEVFLQAIKESNVESVKILLSTSLQRLNLCDALIASCQTGHAVIVELIMKASPLMSLRNSDDRGRRALHYACECGPLNIVVQLVKKGHVLNVSDYDGFTPLHLAAQHGHTDIVEYLVAKCAHINSSRANKEYVTPLHLAAKSGHSRTVEQLLVMGADGNAKSKLGATPLHFAVSANAVETVNVLCCLSYGIKLNEVNHNGLTPILSAAEEGFLDIVKILMEAGASPDVCDKNGCLPLHLAVFGDHPAVVEFLLSEGANPNCVDHDLRTPLHAAALVKNQNIVKLLISHGADVNAQTLAVGESPLMMAAVFGGLPVVTVLVENDVDVNARDVSDSTVLHKIQTACLESSLREKIIREIIKGGANVNIEDSRSYTPLHRAVFQCALSGDTPARLRPLVQAGACLSSLTPYETLGYSLYHGEFSWDRLSTKRNSPLCWLVWNHVYTSARYLVNAGWNLSTEAWIDLPGNTEEEAEFLTYLRHERRQTKPLAILCRNSIREHLVKVNNGYEILSKIEQLYIPKALKLFLQLTDVGF